MLREAAGNVLPDCGAWERLQGTTRFFWYAWQPRKPVRGMRSLLQFTGFVRVTKAPAAVGVVVYSGLVGMSCLEEYRFDIGAFA